MRPARHLIRLLIIALVALSAGEGAAGAEAQDVSRRTGDEAVTIIATADGDFMSPGSGSGSVRCSLWHVPTIDLPEELTGRVTAPVVGSSYLLWCTNAAGSTNTYRLIVWDPTTVITVPQLADQARDELRVRVVRPETSPTDGTTLPGIETWFWAPESQWKTATATASASVPGYSVSVTATARPYKMVFDFGDGSTSTCTANGGRGTAYRPDLPEDSQPLARCTHVFQRSGTHAVAVRTYYSVSISSSTGAAPAIADLFSVATVPITVTDRQAVIGG